MELQQAFDEFLLYLEVEQNYSEHTLTGYESDLHALLRFLTVHKRSTMLQELNPTIIRRFIQYQRTKTFVSPRTLQRRISSLKSFCTFCLKEKFIDEDFMAGIKAPKSDSKLPVYMNLEELKQLFSSLENDNGPLSLRNEALFKLMATTGMRKSELVHLTWQQLDFYNETILILGKGKRNASSPSIPWLFRY